MKATRFFAPFVALTLFAISQQSSQAATLISNGIAPFDTNLGTLTHVLVTLDPLPAQTSIHGSGFSSISTHGHFVTAPPASVLGLGSFPFAFVISSSASSPVFGNHSHTVDLTASVQNFSGAGLSWFLNPGNSPINTVAMPQFPVSSALSHNHSVNLLPIVPRTVYTYTVVVPEPASLGLLAIGGLAMLIRRKRSI